MTCKVAALSASPGYNLGIEKLTQWARSQGWTVDRLADFRPLDGFAYDLVVISAIFSWDLGTALSWAQSAQGELWMGGPAISANAHYVQRLLPHAQITIGPDQRFERQPGQYRWVRWGRGCSVGCWFCIVPKVDGEAMVEYTDSCPARVIVDDNIVRYSQAHQERIVEQTLRANLRRIDINSGFDPAVFTQWHYDLYSQLDLQYWRTAYDTLSEGPQVERMLGLLSEMAVTSRRIPVYMLAGAEPFEQSMMRARQIVAWGGEPRVQMFKPLNWMGRRSDPWVHPKHGWSQRQVVNFPRYWYSYKWRSETWDTWLDRQAG